MKRHKWITDKIGNKKCSVCQSVIRSNHIDNFGKIKFIETDSNGISDPVNWYPRCLYVPRLYKDIIKNQTKLNEKGN